MVISFAFASGVRVIFYNQKQLMDEVKRQSLSVSFFLS